jgi:hypothetical protein
MTIRMVREIFWLKDPANLFGKDTWTRFVPVDSMTVPEALNAVVRFTVYFGILITLITGETNYLLFIPIVMAMTVALVHMYPTTQVLKESYTNKGEYSTPTSSNPFMNVLFTDYVDDVGRPPAPPNINNPSVRESIEEAFSVTSDLFMDTSDKYGLAQAARQFVTQASTTIPNDLEGFQTFLNKDNVSRKASSEGYVVAKGSTQELSLA